MSNRNLPAPATFPPLYLDLSVRDIWFAVHDHALAPGEAVSIADIADTLTAFARGIAQHQQRELEADTALIAKLAEL